MAHTISKSFVALETPLSAIECAVAIQRALADHRRAHGFSPQVRIGLHAPQPLAEVLSTGGRASLADTLSVRTLGGSVGHKMAPGPPSAFAH